MGTAVLVVPTIIGIKNLSTTMMPSSNFHHDIRDAPFTRQKRKSIDTHQFILPGIHAHPFQCGEIVYGISFQLAPKPELGVKYIDG